MEMCELNHEQIVHEGGVCPLCDMRFELNAVIDEQLNEIESLKREIEELKNKLEVKIDG